MAANNTAQPDFAKHYGNKRLSDVELVIHEEPDLECKSVRTVRGKRRASASAAAVAEELPGHAVVLMAMSGYCCAALENWSSSSSEGKYRLELPVLELGKMLIQGMYCAQVDLAGLTQQQLLQLLLLAD
eukprot:gene48-186_t